MENCFTAFWIGVPVGLVFELMFSLIGHTVHTTFKIAGKGSK
jgi:hypothetical protein